MLRLNNRQKFGILIGVVLFTILIILFLVIQLTSSDSTACPKGSESYTETSELGLMSASGCITSEGVKVGFWSVFNEDQLLEGYGKYENNLKQGEWKYYFKDGESVAYTEKYKDGNLDGKKIFYYNYDKGIKRSEATYSNGILSGEFAKYYENGNLKLKGTYGVVEKDGRMIGEYDGELYYFNENGDIENIEYYNLGEKIEKSE